MNVLASIMAERAADAEAAAREAPAADLEALASARTHRSLAAALASAPVGIIAELKKASPSAGLLRADYRPAELARTLAAAGACALSVLTEPRHFLGSAEHLKAARAAVDLPILRKDFVAHPRQILEAAAWGADVVLLIVAGLDAHRLVDLYAESLGRGLEVLVETHTPAELAAALELPAAIVGVNSRNLKTLKTDLRTARELAALIPPDRLSVAESGIRDRADVLDLQARGYRGFLIGEALATGADPAAALRRLLGGAAPHP